MVWVHLYSRRQSEVHQGRSWTDDITKKETSLRAYTLDAEFAIDRHIVRLLTFLPKSFLLLSGNHNKLSASIVKGYRQK